MQMYKKIYCQPFLFSLLTKEDRTIQSKTNTTPYKYGSQIIRAITFTVMSTVTLFSCMANAMTITSDMSPEVANEFNKQIALQTWPKMHTKLAFMNNPYSTFEKVIKQKVIAEAEVGQPRRLMSHEESIMLAKKKRFDYCQASVSFFVGFAERAHTLSTLEEQPLTKDKLMKGNGVKYPFTEAETNNANTRPAQIALTLGWKHQGKGENHAELFLKTCLAIPVSLYYKEDKI